MSVFFFEKVKLDFENVKKRVKNLKFFYIIIIKIKFFKNLFKTSKIL